MLARRDQWQDYLGVHHIPQESEAYLLQAVDSVVRDALDRLQSLLEPYASQLLDLQQYAAANLGQPVPLGEPGTDPADLPQWRKLQAMLLTKGGGWRQRLDKNAGFPPGPGEPTERKAQLKAIIGELLEIDGAIETLAAVSALPEIESGSASWQLVLQLSHVLPMLAAQLLLVFTRHGVVDHSQVALSALQALGDDDAPTELALRLDYQLEHILVDEFQDTAINQYELLRRLTRGWGQHNATNPQQPRTIMLVGDGMQSIYGFRDANVGLFLKARLEGFNGVALEHIALQSNFRSDAGIVDWVNDTFVKAFPSSNDIGRGQVSFSAAVAVRPASALPAVGLHGFHGELAREQEVAFICEQIARACADPECGSLAVLGRSRSHLQPVIAGLKQRGIEYAAQDMDRLGSSPLVADLLSLCRALVNSADRLAWMAILRAPWCGLTLADLLVIANWGEHARYQPVQQTLFDPGLSAQLSADGAQRLARILPCLQRTLQHRDRLALRVWIEQFWVELGGPATAGEARQLDDAESFFQLLELAERDGVGLDPLWLESQLQKRYVNADNPGSKIQLMTLHKAKGLEFDTVIIPRLGGTTAADGRQLLLWDEHSSSSGQRNFLLAADDHSEDAVPTLYNYLRQRRKDKALLETTRLLYVGATRAVRQLLLTATITPDPRNEHFRAPSSSSLLASIWPTFEQQMRVHEPLLELEQEAADRGTAGQLQRLQYPPSATPLLSGQTARTAGNLPLRPDNYRERCIGTVVHLALEELSRCERLPTGIGDRDRARWRTALAGMGLWGTALEQAVEAVAESVLNSLADTGAGRWILSSDHPHARSEWALSAVNTQGQVENLVIDRCFVDATTGLRWLVDYKNSRPLPGETEQDFMKREGVSYAPQLLRYREVLRELCDEAIRCALYFPTLGQLHHLKELDVEAG
jgi:ATP-dependent exoDNAse (exonuclease V) beta subunit